MSRSEGVEGELLELFRQAQASTDPRRFDAILERMLRAYEQDVLALARRRSERHAADIASETWAAIPHALETFDGNATFHTWLLRIVAHKTVDVLRRAKDERYERLSAVFSRLIGSQPTPSGLVVAKERAELVHRVIAELEPDDQELILLHYGEEKSAADIARERGLAPNTVAQRLVRVRQRLKDALTTLGVSRA